MLILRWELRYWLPNRLFNSKECTVTLEAGVLSNLTPCCPVPTLHYGSGILFHPKTCPTHPGSSFNHSPLNYKTWKSLGRFRCRLVQNRIPALPLPLSPQPVTRPFVPTSKPKTPWHLWSPPLTSTRALLLFC